MQFGWNIRTTTFDTDSEALEKEIEFLKRINTKFVRDQGAAADAVFHRKRNILFHPEHEHRVIRALEKARIEFRVVLVHSTPWVIDAAPPEWVQAIRDYRHPDGTQIPPWHIAPALVTLGFFGKHSTCDELRDAMRHWVIFAGAYFRGFRNVRAEIGNGSDNQRWHKWGPWSFLNPAWRAFVQEKLGVREIYSFKEVLDFEAELGDLFTFHSGGLPIDPASGFAYLGKDGVMTLTGPRETEQMPEGRIQSPPVQWYGPTPKIVSECGVSDKLIPERGKKFLEMLKFLESKGVTHIGFFEGTETRLWPFVTESGATLALWGLGKRPYRDYLEMVREHLNGEFPEFSALFALRHTEPGLAELFEFLEKQSISPRTPI